MKVKKSEIRARYEAEYGDKLPAGKMQVSDHGANTYSIQIFRAGKCVTDVNVKKEIVN